MVLNFLGARWGGDTTERGPSVGRDGRGPIASVASSGVPIPWVLTAPKSRDRNDYPSDQARKAGPADPALEISIMNIAPTGGLPSRYRIEVEADDRMRQDIEVISDSLALSTGAVRGW